MITRAASVLNTSNFHCDFVHFDIAVVAPIISVNCHIIAWNARNHGANCSIRVIYWEIFSVCWQKCWPSHQHYIQCAFHLLFGPIRFHRFSINWIECICACNGMRSIVLYSAICKSVVRQLPALLLPLLCCWFCKLSLHGRGVAVLMVEEGETHLFSYFVLKLSHPFNHRLLLLPLLRIASLHNLFGAARLAMKLSKLIPNESFVQIVIFTSPSLSPPCFFSISKTYTIKHKRTKHNYRPTKHTTTLHKTQTNTQFTRKKNLYDTKFI